MFVTKQQETKSFFTYEISELLVYLLISVTIIATCFKQAHFADRMEIKH